MAFDLKKAATTAQLKINTSKTKVFSVAIVFSLPVLMGRTLESLIILFSLETAPNLISANVLIRRRMVGGSL